MRLRKCSIAFIMVLLLFPSACNDNNLNTQTNKGEVNKYMQNIDLREVDKETNKKNIDVMLEKVRKYHTICSMSDFTPKDYYANFEATNVNVYNEDDYRNFNVYYRLKTNEKEGDFDATSDITFYESQADSHDVMRNSLNEYTAPKIFPSSLDIGDFAIGGIYSINFIRDNVFISVTGYDEIEIDDLARAIDQQILDILGS